MCDPVTLSVIGTVAGMAGTGMNAIGAMRAQKKQEKNIDSWAAKQNMNREAEQARQEDLRKRAEVSRVSGVEALGAEAQAKTQAEEEARLSKYLQGEGDAAEANPEAGLAVSGADKGLINADIGDATFKSDLAGKLNAATQGAKQRLAALARVSSYGGSSGGLGTVNPMTLSESGQGIDLANEKRRGSLSAYGLEKAVDPVQVQFQPSPLADIFSAIGNVGAQSLGNLAAGGKASGLTGLAGAFGKRGAVTDPWAGLRTATTF